MDERVHAGGCHVGVLLKVAPAAETWTGVTQLNASKLKVMRHWVDTGGGDVRVLAEVPGGVEETGSAY